MRRVDKEKPFKIVYSIYQHQYLGYLFDANVVQVDENGKLTYLYQNISSANASEFSKALNSIDFELIKLIDSIQQEYVVKAHCNKKITAVQFFLSVYDKEKGNKELQECIHHYLESKRARILQLLSSEPKLLFEMGTDGLPIYKPIRIAPQAASVLFHVFKNEHEIHYFPTIKYNGHKVDFAQKGDKVRILCQNPAWLVVDGTLYHFKDKVDGKKFMPFLHKKYISIPPQREEEFCSKFLVSLLEQHEVHAEGIKIIIEKQPLSAVLQIEELSCFKSVTLFGEAIEAMEEDKILFKLEFFYGRFQVPVSHLPPSYSIKFEKNEETGKYVFHKIIRDTQREKLIIEKLQESGIEVRTHRTGMPKSKAFDWLNCNLPLLQSFNIEVRQNFKLGKRYFIGEQRINLEIRENQDWFDIHAEIRFGEYKISFATLRKYILANQREFPLPNGEIAVIPDTWFVRYSELFHFATEENRKSVLPKHHLALLFELRTGNYAHVVMSRKLESLRNFEEIGDYEIPSEFRGALRPYQKAGYNWMNFLDEFNFGGILADDMGLGKTVQTLALLVRQKMLHPGMPSLLVMPTSLLYNWEKEAQRFAPTLKVLNYTGTSRLKDISQFRLYDLILTSYGVLRLDVDILKDYYFNYIILDESQAIKNPQSHISKAVMSLKSRRKLALTGTPVENSTLDLWSQMSFVNPGLLGSQGYFKKVYQSEIERKNNDEQTQRLYAIIKPFILRRHKSQVAQDLPEKTEYIQYVNMTAEQEKLYEETKNSFRHLILSNVENYGMAKSSIVILRGLTMLRQIANHPKMVKEDYNASSGKLEDVTYKLQSIIGMGHKVLIFSQFVKHLHLLRDYLRREHIPFAYLDGSTTDRQSEVIRFQQNPQVCAFLISLKAGGVGLNLTAADYVFLLDPWWNPAVENQAIDRAHRIGQQNKVIIYKFITKNTVEEKILELQRYKLQLAESLIVQEESFMKNLTKEDIEILLG
ncbi:MAG: SNF2-related protein [Cytophagales bacterium]|nr:SNF2-related protein [Cytophagales bacterium]MDW8384821.1 SNF2-related protein [Flammeovirgaceae bacterium]